MNHKLTLFYILLSSIIIIVQAQRPSVHKTKINKKIYVTTPMYRLQQRQKLPLFPKNTMRFIVTPQPFDNQKDEVILQTKKPLLTKFLIKHRSEDNSNLERRPVTRRPLMKTIDFVNNPVKIKNKEKRETNLKDLQNKELARDEEYSEEVTEPNYQEMFDIDELLFPISFIDHKHLNTDIKTSDVPVEEEDGPMKFISLKSEEFNHKDKYSLRDAKLFNEDSDLRIKRHVNIIEEENQPTTISEFKYTSGDSRLSNDLVFKNINA